MRKRELEILNNRGVRLLMVVVFVGLAYGFASLAIDSGSWLEYALTIIFLVWAVKSVRHSIRS